MHKDVVIADKGLTPLFFGVVVITTERMAVWKSKKLHGRFHRVLMG